MDNHTFSLIFSNENVCVMGHLATAMIYGQTVRDMLDKAESLIGEGEFGMAADVMQAAAIRVDLFIEYGV